MTTNLVLIVNTGSLLIDELEGFLKSSFSDEYEVVSTLVHKRTELVREIDRIKPSVLIIEDITPMVTPPELITALRKDQNIRVIILNS